MRKSFRKEKKKRIKTAVNHGFEKLEELNEAEIQEAKSIEFLNDDRKKKTRMNRALIMSGSIFGEGKVDRKVVELQRKLSRLP